MRKRVYILAFWIRRMIRYCGRHGNSLYCRVIMRIRGFEGSLHVNLYLHCQYNELSKMHLYCKMMKGIYDLKGLLYVDLCLYCEM